MSNTLRSCVDDISFCATEFLPTGESRNITLFCLPGGGASAQYFDLHPNFSFAVKMAARGFRVVTMDHPGTATNPLSTDYPFLTPRQAADLIARALGDFTDGSPVIGIGHSMGGMVATLVQARHSAFEALGLFGSSAGGLEWGLSEAERKYIDQPDAFEKDIQALTLGKFGCEFTSIPAGPSGKSITFGGETPELTQSLRDASCELFAAGGMMSMVRGSFRTEVEAIDVPMMFAFGDHDIGIPPAEAPKAYINAPTTELVILDKTGHNHFAFKSIESLCANLDHWISNLDSVSRKR